MPRVDELPNNAGPGTFARHAITAASPPSKNSVVVKEAKIVSPGSVVINGDNGSESKEPHKSAAQAEVRLPISIQDRKTAKGKPGSDLEVEDMDDVKKKLNYRDSESPVNDAVAPRIQPHSTASNHPDQNSSASPSVNKAPSKSSGGPSVGAGVQRVEIKERANVTIAVAGPSSPHLETKGGVLDKARGPGSPGRPGKHSVRSVKSRPSAVRRAGARVYPDFKADGEPEPAYLQFIREQERTLRKKSMLAYLITYLLLEVNYLILPAGGTFVWQPLLLRVAMTLILLVHWLCCINRQPSEYSIFGKCSDQPELLNDVLLSLVLGLSGILLVIMDAIRPRVTFAAHSADGLLLTLICIYFFALRLVRLRLACAVSLSVVLFAAYTVALAVIGAPLTYIVATDFYQALVLVGLLSISWEQEDHRRRDNADVRVLIQERRKGEDLLESMLPPQILGDFLNGKFATLSAVATIGFCQIYMRTPKTSSGPQRRGSFAPEGPSPSELMQKLHDMFKRIDSIVGLLSVRGVAKIETVSKTYLLCSGLLEPIEDHAAAMIDTSLEIMNMVSKQVGKSNKLPIVLRIGIATGHVVGGIIGSQRRYFRVFGDTVNVAARMCTNAKDGQIMFNSVTYQALHEREKKLYKIPKPQTIFIKGKNNMECYTVESRDDWVPRFTKSVMSRGAYGPPANPGSTKKSFAYHKLLENTTVTPALTYQTVEKELAPNYHSSFAQWTTPRLRLLHGFWTAALIGLIGFWLGTGTEKGAAVTLTIIVAALFALQVIFSATSAYRRALQVVAGSVTVLLAVWAIALVFTTSPGTILLPPLAMITVIVYGLSLTRLEFRYAAPLSTLAVVSFIVALAARSAPWFEVVMVGTNLLACLACGIAAQLNMEREAKYNFLNKYALIKEQSIMDNFLDNMLPRFVVDVLRQRPELKGADSGPNSGGGGNLTSTRFAMSFPQATVFESDIVGYTALVSSWQPAEVLKLLNNIFSRFDEACLSCKVEKIETIGDAFMAVTMEGNPDPILDFALEACRLLGDCNRETNQSLQIRMGIATGIVYGGIVGSKIPRFHIFGEAHDLAIKIEQNGSPGQIIVIGQTHELAKGRYQFQAKPGVLEDYETFVLQARLVERRSSVNLGERRTSITRVPHVGVIAAWGSVPNSSPTSPMSNHGNSPQQQGGNGLPNGQSHNKAPSATSVIAGNSPPSGRNTPNSHNKRNNNGGAGGNPARNSGSLHVGPKSPQKVAPQGPPANNHLTPGLSLS